MIQVVMPILVVPHHLTHYYVFDFRYKSQPTKESRLQYKCSSDPHNVAKMKFSLISLIALALTSTSVMAAAQPMAIEKRAATTSGWIKQQVAKGRKTPRNEHSVPTAGTWYNPKDDIIIKCYTDSESENTGITTPKEPKPD
jgi:hypothetical protein